MILVYLVISLIFGFMLLFEARESKLEFFPPGIGSAMTYLAILGLSLVWPFLLAMMLYDTFKESRLDRFR